MWRGFNPLEVEKIVNKRRMDRNTIIGFLLIFGLLIAWQQFMKPSEQQLAAEQQLQDSLRQEQLKADSLAALQAITQPANDVPADSTQAAVKDSLMQTQLAGTFGPFATAAAGKEETVTLENDLLRLAVSTKGGRIVEAEVKNYKKVVEDEKHQETKEPLLLLEDEKNRFEYLLPVSGVPNGTVSTEDLYFEVERLDNGLLLKAEVEPGRYFAQRYSLEDGSYNVDYSIQFKGLEPYLSRDAGSIELNWVNYLDKLEKNVDYERNYSTVYYKPSDDSPDHCSCTSNDTEEIDDVPIKWISNTNQFFNTSIIAESSFKSAVLIAELVDEDSPDLKKLHSRVKIPYGEQESFDMDFYIGPNEFKLLQAYDLELQNVIPFGSSIFGTVNRWVIRPVFSFLSTWIGSAGIVILVLTFLVKLALYPFTYRMLYSQSKMGALKPHLEAMKAKFKDDPQRQQTETMKVYQEFGVNPLGGCLPVVLQMPIWFALYRFFPASIEFRQKSFLWATDLSSYDVAFILPFEIPFYGDHVSLFTLLWAGTTVIYTYYNSRHMDMSVNPAMKYMQYFMPVMFLFFFNNFAAGLTCYLLFSNIFNIAQTLITKNVIIDQEKIAAELERNRSKPKKKKGFQKRLQDALDEQRKIQADRDKQKKKKK
jgi:YidC/Oxa1 family membrane protein insertase